MIWMVSRHKDGKYFDGYYGLDSYIHDDNQIFNRKHIPYEIDSEFLNIVVGVGEKPTVDFVRSLLEKSHK